MSGSCGNPAFIGGRYEAYKRATILFLDWLALKSQPKPATVRAILKAVHNLRSQGVKLPSDVANHLRNAIQLRKEVHQLYEERVQDLSLDDERHKYFIYALETAKNSLSGPAPVVLLPDISDGSTVLVSTASMAAASSHEFDIEAFANRFEILAVEEVLDMPDGEPAAKTPSSLIGERVVIQGLIGKPELNGRNGSIISYVEASGRYVVSIGGQSYGLMPVNMRIEPMASDDEHRDLLGETVQFQAACLLLDLKEVLQEVEDAWGKYRDGQHSLLEATALTNACVRHAARLASAVELQMPTLNCLERVVCAAYLIRTVVWVGAFLQVPFETALDVVSDITHGTTSDTVLPTIKSERVILGVKLYACLHHAERSREGEGKKAGALMKASKAVRQSVPGSTDEQIGEVLRRVTGDIACRFACPNFEAQTLHDPEDFYCGNNGLLLTAAFVRVLASPSLNIVRRPKVWSTPKSGFFGLAWNEESNPAKNTDDLRDYLGSILPALLSFAHGESKSIQMPQLKMGTLMPLWQLLEDSMDSKGGTLMLVIAMQVALISLVRVNGGRRCKRLQVTTRLAFSTALKQIDHGIATFTEAAAKGCRNSKMNSRNFEMLRCWVDFVERRHTTPPLMACDGGPEMEAISVRQRDHALLQNPWVAGQQLLVLHVGLGIGCGSKVLDSVGQASFAVHLQNALRVAGAAEPVVLIDVILMKAFCPDNKAIWFAGIPPSNFAKAWKHRMGMDSNVLSNRKLVGLEPEDISLVYRYVAEADFSGLQCIESMDPLPIVLESICSAFATDTLIGVNLAALGTQLASLPERLVDLLGLHAHFKKNRRDEKNRRDALHRTLVSELMFLCEREVPDKSQPFHTGTRPGGPDKKAYLNTAGREFGGREDLPPCSTSERDKIEHAGRVVKDFLDSIPASSYRLAF